MRNIKFSKTFSFIIILIVSAYFLIPNIITSINLYQIEKNESDVRKSYINETVKRANLIRDSFQRLSIKDNNLTRCIQDELKVYMKIHPSSSGGINSVNELKFLKCSNRNIVSIDGIQQLADLEFLDLNDNNIKDISPLLSLDKLQTIYLGGNQLSNPELVFKIASLRRVVLPDMSNLYCADIAFLIRSVEFQALNFDKSMAECMGSSNGRNDINLLYAKKRSGLDLTQEEEIKILQYETNQKKAEYSNKKEAYDRKYNK